MCCPSIVPLHPQLWDSRAKRCRATFEHQYQATAVAVSPNGDQVYSGSIDNVVYVRVVVVWP